MNSKTIPLMSLVVPVFNESKTIPLFVSKITSLFKNNKLFHYEFIFVNDGSSDNTFDQLIKIKKKYSGVTIIDLSRNFGKESALTAGLKFSNGDIIVPIDVDLQDPPDLIFEMFSKWVDGNDVVVARRIDRSSDSFSKSFFSKNFYRIYNLIADVKMPENVGDFRLMDKSVVDTLNSLPESNRFMKGLFSWVGFKTAFVDYSRPERSAGNTKFSLWSLWKLAIEGITSFSSVPLRIWFYLGLFIATSSFLFSIYIIINKIFFGIDTPGYASLAVLIVFFGGIQIMGIGVIGEYLGRSYIESKRRPVFVVRKIYK